MFVIFLRTVRASDATPYEKACNLSSFDFVLVYNSSERVAEATILVRRSFPLIVATNGIALVRDPLLGNEDVSAEVKFLSNQEPVAKRLTSLGVSDAATVSYSCSLAENACTTYCTLGPYSFMFFSGSWHRIGMSSDSRIPGVCRQAADDLSLIRSKGFHGRWMRVCLRMYEVPTKDYGDLVFRYVNESGLAVCDFRSPLPFRFGIKIQRPGHNRTMPCGFSDRTVVCSIAVDVKNITDSNVLQCCVSSSVTRRYCVGLRGDEDGSPETTVSPVSSDEGIGRTEMSDEGIVGRASDENRVVVSVVSSLALAFGTTVVVLLVRRRLGSRLSDDFVRRVSFRSAYRSTATNG